MRERMDDGSQESEMSLDLTVNDLQTPRCGKLSESIIKKKRKGNYFQGLSLRRQTLRGGGRFRNRGGRTYYVAATAPRSSWNSRHHTWSGRERGWGGKYRWNSWWQQGTRNGGERGWRGHSRQSTSFLLHNSGFVGRRRWCPWPAKLWATRAEESLATRAIEWLWLPVGQTTAMVSVPGPVAHEALGHAAPQEKIKEFFCYHLPQSSWSCCSGRHIFDMPLCIQHKHPTSSLGVPVHDTPVVVLNSAYIWQRMEGPHFSMRSVCVALHRWGLRVGLRYTPLRVAEVCPLHLSCRLFGLRCVPSMTLTQSWQSKEYQLTLSYLLNESCKWIGRTSFLSRFITAAFNKGFDSSTFLFLVIGGLVGTIAYVFGGWGK